MIIYHLGFINDSQLGYSGAVIGGAMTLIGVWWTIKKQEDQRKAELIVQYKPTISLINITNEYKKDINTITLLNHTPDIPDILAQENEKYDNDFYIIIKNTGRGNAINLCIENKSFKSDPLIQKKINLQNQYKCSVLSIGEKIILKLSFPLGMQLEKDYIFQMPIHFEYHLSLSDEFNYYKYLYSLEVDVVFSKNNFYKEHLTNESMPYYFSYKLLNYKFQLLKRIPL